MTLLVLAPFVLRRNLVSAAGNPLPPGPLFRYPVITKQPEYLFDRWAKAYGHLFSLWMGNKLFIVISDPQVARDLLVTQGAIFSGRSPSMKNTTILQGRGITASGYDDKWYVSFILILRCRYSPPLRRVCALRCFVSLLRSLTSPPASSSTCQLYSLSESNRFICTRS
jgi:hypothetical protein